MRLFFLFFLIVSLNATVYRTKGKYNSDWYYLILKEKNVKSYYGYSICGIDNTWHFFLNSGSYSTYDGLGFQGDLNLSRECTDYYATTFCSTNTYGTVQTLPDFVLDFCKNHSGCNFKDGAWFCSDKVICPDGQIYDSKQEKCIPKPQCPSGTQLHELAIKKCYSEEFVKVETCDPDTGKINIVCKDCKDIINKALQYCKTENKFLSDGIYCSDNNGTLSVSFKSYNDLICSDNPCKPGQLAVKSGNTYSCYDINSSNNSICPEGQIGISNSDGSYSCEPMSSDNAICKQGEIGISNSDGTITCYSLKSDDDNVCPVGTLGVSHDGHTVCLLLSDNNFSNNVSSSDTNNSNSISSSNISNTNNSVNKSSSQNDSNTTASNNSNKQCPDPCQIAQQIGTESRIEGTCHIITKPVYNGCVLEWHNDKNGKCVPGCGDNKDTNTSAKLNDISGKLSTANATLKSINDTLNDLKDLKPDGNFNPGEGKLDSQESGLISDLKTFFSNTKNSLQNLKKSYDDVLNMIKNPKQFTLFKTTDSYSCPIVVETKHFHFAPDICKFVYPYKPLLQLFFTLVFSIAVVFYFFDVILRGNR